MPYFPNRGLLLVGNGEWRLHSLHNMRQCIETILNGCVHTTLHSFGGINPVLMELCSLKFVLTDHERSVHPFLHQITIASFSVHKQKNAVFVSLKSYLTWNWAISPSKCCWELTTGTLQCSTQLAISSCFLFLSKHSYAHLK